jgi:outer membrane lipoprotein-sorting protein
MKARALGLGFVGCAALFIAALSPRPVTAAIPPPAGGIKQQLIQHYRSLQTFQATINSVTTLQPTNGSQPNVIQSTIKIVYKKPNLVRITTEGLTGGGEVISNGKTLFTFAAMANQYTEQPAPADIGERFIGPLKSGPNLKATGHTVIDGAPVDIYTGMAATKGVPTQYTLYVDRSADLIRRLILRIPRLSGPQGANFHLTVQQDYTQQVLNKPVPASQFQFTPPSGAQKGAPGDVGALTGMFGVPNQ